MKLKDKGKKGSGYVYKKRGTEDWKKRSNQRGGLYDNTVKDGFQIFLIKDGAAFIRIMPPTFDNATHYGMDVFQHFGIGPDEQAYLCLDKMKGERCPICDEQRRAQRAGDTEYAKELKPAKRCAVWVIDRKHESDGPKVYVMPWTLDRDISAICFDEDTREVLAIDDPDEGFDLKFKREGKGRNTQYLGLKVAQRPSPLSDSPRQKRRWLEYIQENPLDTTLNFYEYDYIKGVFEGKGKDADEDEEGGTKKKKFKKGGKLKPKKKRPSSDPLEDEGDDEPHFKKRKKLKKSKKTKLGAKIRKGLKDRE